MLTSANEEVKIYLAPLAGQKLLSYLSIERIRLRFIHSRKENQTDVGQMELELD